MAKYFCGIDWYGGRPWVYKHLGFTSTIIDHFSSPNGVPEGLTGDGDGNVISGDTTAGKIYKHDGFSSTVTDSFARSQADLAWDGTNLMSALGPKIYRHSGFSAAVSDSFSSTQQIAIGVAWDGSNICETSYTDGPLVIKTYKHSGFSSSIIDSFSGGVGPNQYGGWFDSYGGNLYGMDHSEEQYDRMNGFSNGVNFSIAMPEGQSHGLAWIEGEPLFDSGIRMFGGDSEVGNVVSSDRSIDKIYKHSGFSSTILDSFSNAGNTQGLTWDGTDLLEARDGPDRIYKYDGFSSSITDSFSSPGLVPEDLAWDGTNLMSADAHLNDRIYKHDGFSSSILDNFSSPSSNPRGLTWDGVDLLSCDTASNKIYKHQGFSSTITDSFGASRYSLAWDGTNLLSALYAGTIYKHNGFSSSILDNFSSPGVNTAAITWISGAIEMISVAYRDLKSTHKLRYNKGGTTVVGIPLVESADPVASKIRVFDGSAFKSIAKYEV